MLQCVAVRCSVLQCVAVRCRVLQRVAACCSVLQCTEHLVEIRSDEQKDGPFDRHDRHDCTHAAPWIRAVAVCCSVLRCVAVWCNAIVMTVSMQHRGPELLQDIQVYFGVLQRIAV